MKRILSLILLLCLSLSLSACTLYESHQLAKPLPPEPTESPTQVPSKTPRPSRTPYPTPSPRPTPGPEPTIPPKPVLPTGLEYTNEARGYKLTFPESFRGYYYVNDENPDHIFIAFYGKSKSGTIFLLEHGRHGIPIFSVLLESEIDNPSPIDNKRLLGTAGGKNYYYGTGTDVFLSPLFVSEESIGKTSYGGFVIDETEYKLAKEDRARAEQMMEDTKDIIFTPPFLNS